MAYKAMFLLGSLLLAALTPVASAQDAESDINAIPLRTHSFQTVSGAL